MATNARFRFPAFLGSATCFASLLLPAGAVASTFVSESYGQWPLHFEANQGQAHEDVKFLSRGPGHNLYLTATEVVLVLAQPPSDVAQQDGRRLRAPHEYDTTTPEMAATTPVPLIVRMSLVGGSERPRVRGLEDLPSKANYFIGRDATNWRTDIPTYARVQYDEVYPGVDLVYYGHQRELEYDFVLAPGADPHGIVLAFEGTDRLQIDAAGDLVLHAAGGSIRQRKPTIYQEEDGVRREIAGGYVLRGRNRIGFAVAAYDRNRPLVIDPLVLSYSSYLGGSLLDQPAGVAIDSDGNAYVTGWTWSADFPTTAGSFAPTQPAGVSAFVSKINPAGTSLVYSTYLGDGGGYAIAVDVDGNAYVTGQARSNFPTTPGAFQPAVSGPGDAFVAKLDPTGSGLIYATFLGGSGSELATGIALDPAGNAYLAGGTTSTDFPTANAFQVTHAGGGRAPWDAFMTKLDPRGSALVYSTYLGGSGDEFATGISVDAAANASITGGTDSLNFPITPGASQLVFGGLHDAFVTKLDPSGLQLVFSSYLGGRGADRGLAIAVDAVGNAYLAGYTYSLDFPATAEAFQPNYSVGEGYQADAFVTAMNPAGSSLVYSTYLGGSGHDAAHAIALDVTGSVYVTGATFGSRDFPTPPNVAFPPTMLVPGGAFVSKLNPAGSAVVYSAFLDGNSGAIGIGIAVDDAGGAYLTGYTRSTIFPVTPGAFQITMGGCLDEYTPCDGFVAKITHLVVPSSNTVVRSLAP